MIPGEVTGPEGMLVLNVGAVAVEGGEIGILVQLEQHEPDPPLGIFEAEAFPLVREVAFQLILRRIARGDRFVGIRDERPYPLADHFTKELFLAGEVEIDRAL